MASSSWPASRYASPRTMSRLGARAPAVASRTAGASAGATRKASPKCRTASLNLPATSAVATSLELEGRLGEVARARLLGRVVGPEAEGHRSGRKRRDGGRSRLDRGGGPPRRGLAGLPPVGCVRGPIEQRRRGRWRLVGSGGQTRDRGMPAKIASIEPVALAIARAASRRDSLGRPSEAAASAAISRATGVRPRRHAAPPRPPRPRRPGRRSASGPRRGRRGPTSRARPIPASVSSSVRARASDPSRRCAWARSELGAACGAACSVG